ncbi:MAG: RdgB/HAM1 family non-canonical purine NTP pyrophosphatase [Ruminococcaceae bacterium]|nr:RdgB/HAM1 family non-canonical purine NTP pyrophosphatase [Oscillospiraceae bacterium]
MKIVLASRNQKKIGELRTLLAETLPDVEVLSLDDVGIFGEIEENGATFEENALIKARAAASSGYIGVGDDSGLTVDALGGEPGVYSARFAFLKTGMNDHDDQANNRTVLDLLQDVPTERRGAAFVSAIACVFPDGRSFTVRGEVKGRILTEHHGNGGFGYDPLFYYEPYGKTLAEVTSSEKNAVSHRGKAIRAFAERLKAEI